MKFTELVELFAEAKKKKKAEKAEKAKKMPKKMMKGKKKSDKEEGAYDVNKDGKIEGWEKARSAAIQKNMKNGSKK
jgi:hypothetical protein